MPGPWDKYAAPAPASGMKPLTGPDQSKVVGLQRDIVGLERDRIGIQNDRQGLENEAARIGIAKQDQSIQVQDRPFVRSDKLRQDYEQLAPVKEYRTALPNLMTGLKSAPDAAGDNALIYAYAKVMDPGSVVRESEMGMAGSTGSYIEGKVANLKKQFGIEGGGQLSPDTRDRLRREMNSKAAQLAKAYGAQRLRFQQVAQRQGANPEDVVGGFDAAPYFDEYDRLTGREKESPAAAARPSNERMDFADAPEDPLQGFRLPTEQEGKLVAFAPEAKSPAEILAFARGMGANLTQEEAQKAFDYYQAGGREAVQIGYGKADEQRKAELQAELQRRGQSDPSTMDNVQEIIGQGASFGQSDEVAGVAGIFTGTGYEQERDLARMRQDTARDDLGGVGTALEIAGGFLSANPGAITAAPTLLGRAKDGFRAGTGAGAFSGFGYGNGADESVRQAAVGGALGGMVGGAIPLAGNALSRIPARNTTRQIDRNALLQTAQDIGVDLMPADMGGPFVRRLTGAAAQGPVSAGPVIGGAQRSTAQLGAARSNAASTAGVILPADEAGEAVRKGAELYTKTTSQRGSRLYDRAEQASAGVKISPAQAVSELDGQIASLKESGEAAQPIIAELEKFKRSITQDGGVTVAGLRRVRSIISGAGATEALRNTPAQGIFKKVAETLSSDIEAGLIGAGKDGAARLFRTADDFWKARVEQIDEVLQPVLGKGRSGEDILAAVERMGEGKSGGVRRLSRLMASLPADEAASVRATLINRIGGEGDTFTPTKFATMWNDRMSAKGKTALFGNGEVRANLDKIAKVASAMKESGKYQNFSNTAGGLAGQAVLTGGLATGGIMPLVLGSAAQFVSGKLLASPAFTRWLARAPRTAAGASRYTQQLSSVAAREPAIAGDIQALQSHLARAFEQSPGRAAADDEPNGRREPPRR